MSANTPKSDLACCHHGVRAELCAKQTEIGVIPLDWEVKLIGDLGRVVRGSSPRPAGDPRFFNGSFIPWLTVAALTNVPEHQLAIAETAGYLTGEGAKYSRILNPDTLIIANSGATLGVAKLIKVQCCANDGIAAVIEQHSGDKAFLCQYINTQTDRLRNIIATGNGQPNLNTALIKDIPVPYPPEPEQHVIAEALSDIDSLIGALEKLIAKKRAIKQATMQQLLTGKTRLPGFTGKWNMRRLGDHVRYLTHGVNSRAELDVEGPVRYLHYGDVHAAAGPSLKPGNVPMPRLPVEKCSGLDRLESGDLVLVDASEDLVGIGKSVELRNVDGIEVVAGLHTIAARFGKDILADGFKGYLQHIPAFKSHLEKLAAGTKVYATNRSHISSAELLLPSVQEQSAIAAVLSDMDAEIEALERRRDKVKQIKQGMMQQLLTGRIRLVKPQASAAPADTKAKENKAHNWQIEEAVVIGVLAKIFGNEDWPLARKRRVKLTYLLDRHIKGKAEGYLKKAAGPYNPASRYKGPEAIAVKNGYVREHGNGKYAGFIAGDKIAQAEEYFEKWLGPDTTQWLKQFLYRKTDDLELLATVDMAAEDLRTSGKTVDVNSVKGVIRNHPEWQPKLDRSVFSDGNIAKAIDECKKLFG